VYEILEEWREHLLARFRPKLATAHEPVPPSAAPAHGDD
jgi:hypothetical protein